MTRSRIIRLGDDIDANCARCGDVRSHQVLSLAAAGKPDRIVCRTCHGQKKYRGESLSAPSVSSRPVKYSPTGSYQEGQFIDHAKFGSGKVVAVRPGKIDVKFGGEMRTLLHAG